MQLQHAPQRTTAEAAEPITAVAAQDVTWTTDVVYALPAACLTAVILTTVRRWLRQHEQRTRLVIAENDRRYRARTTDLDERERALDAREATLERREYLTDIRVRGLADRLDQTLNALAEERTAHEELRSNYRELTTEYNQLVEDTLQERHAFFTRRGPRPPRLPRSRQPWRPAGADRHEAVPSIAPARDQESL